jgi:hypothetical protein
MVSLEKSYLPSDVGEVRLIISCRGAETPSVGCASAFVIILLIIVGTLV